jgi:hypothetical protein
MKGFYNAMKTLCSPDDDVEGAAEGRHCADPAPRCARGLGAHATHDMLRWLYSYR